MNFQFIRNILSLASVAYPFLKIYLSGFQFHREKGELFEFWNTLRREMPLFDSLDPSLVKRIGHYLQANSFTSQWFSILHNYTLTKRDRQAGWFLAVATPIADYLADEESLSYDQISAILSGDREHTYAEISRYLYRRAKQLHPDGRQFDRYLDKTLLAQEESLHQSSNNLPITKLKEITWNKGGYALLLYRSAINKKISRSEEKAIWQLGGLMQLHNDIFDLYRDLQEKIYTIPSCSSDIVTLHQSFNEEIFKTVRLFESLDCSKNAQLKFFLLLHLAVGTGHICLEQYGDLQEKYGAFEPHKYPRHELICDMESFRKICKTILYSLRQQRPIIVPLRPKLTNFGVKNSQV